jgi:hypothetical protein
MSAIIKSEMISRRTALSLMDRRQQTGIGTGQKK